tara:strand:- start:922 stop:2436 length:1515 start_codon:yes stop_codon:yes gene_type:complete
MDISETKDEFISGLVPGVKEIDNSYGRVLSLDKLYIMPCLNEVKAPGSFDKENSSTRLQKCGNNSVLVGKKMNRRLSNVCNTTKAEDANSNLECTYNGAIEYVPSTITSSKKCTHQTFWNDIHNFMTEQKDYHRKNLKFFMVSHHHRMLKTIFKPLIIKIQKKSFKIANCTCFHFKYVNGGWNLSIIYDGFPDKSKSNYFRKNGEDELVLYDDSSKSGMFFDENQDAWYKFTETYLKNKLEGCEIFLIRHGNAFHNQPLDLKGSNVVTKAINRNLDTNLTPMGILQARLLGRYLVKKKYLTHGNDDNVYCASYLNRSQHTCTELLFELNYSNITANFDYKTLLLLERFFSKVALIRIMRKANYKVENIVYKLANFDMNKLSKDKFNVFLKDSNENSLESFLTNYFYELLADSLSFGENIDIFKGLQENSIKSLIEGLCLSYNSNLPISSIEPITSMTSIGSGGRKRTKKRRKKRYRHKKTYSSRKKTRRKTRRKLKKNKKKNRK